MLVNFNQSSYGVMENDGTVGMTISLSQPSSVEFQVMINTMNVTAIGIIIVFMVSILLYLLFSAGEDYNGSPITLNVPAGVIMESLAINIIENNTVECNETFNVTIVSVTTCGVTIGSNNSSEVMITDDDGKHRFIMIIFIMSENII